MNFNFFTILFCFIAKTMPICFAQPNPLPAIPTGTQFASPDNFSDTEVLWMHYKLARISIHRLLNSANEPSNLTLDALENLFSTALLIASQSPELPYTDDLFSDLFELLTRFKQQQWQNNISSFTEETPLLNQFKTGDLPQKIRSYCSQNNAAVLDYFWGRKNLFLMIINHKGISLQSTPISREFKTNFDFVRANLEFFDPQLNPEDFLQAIKRLSTALIPNSTAILAPPTGELIVIPDGLLFNLSFDILLPENLSLREETNFKTAPFLFKSHAISYLTHANKIFAQYSIPEKNPESVLFAGFAPEFNTIKTHCTSTERLNCNLDEVQSIADQISGEVFLGEHASLENIRHIGSRAKILHIATHACYQEGQSGHQGLHLQDTSIDTKDWNTLALQGELLVLSACNTAKMNHSNPGLAHNFISLGVPAVVASLWTQEDCIASRVMLGFYRALFQGYRQNVALQKAKLQFLRDASKIYQHPYFWASYISLGVQKPLVRKMACRSRLLFLSVLGSMAFFVARHT